MREFIKFCEFVIGK